MKPQTFIFIGRSGCGKGTQAKLLQDYLKKTDPSLNTLYIQTGSEFREFIKGTSLTQQLCKELYEAGGLQPEFLSVYMWTNVLVNNYTRNEHLIFDGTPRKFHEAGVLHSILEFYNIKKPFLIHIDVSKEEAKRRLMARKRMDDNEADIDKRLSWYESEVAPALEFYKNNPEYIFLSIDGQRPPEEIHEQITKGLNTKIADTK